MLRNIGHLDGGTLLHVSVTIIAAAGGEALADDLTVASNPTRSVHHLGLAGLELQGRGHRDVEHVPLMVQVGNLFAPWVELTIYLVVEH